MRRLVAILLTLLHVHAALAMSPAQRQASLSSRASTPSFEFHFDKNNTLPGWLSFSRAGNAMITDATGKLTYAPNNVLRNAATLIGSWATVGTAPNNTTGQADKDGGTQAVKIAFTPGSDGAMFENTGSTLATTLASVWVRADAPGTIGYGNSNIARLGSISLTTAWQQVYFTIPPSGGGLTFYYNHLTDTQPTFYIYKPVQAAVTYETTPRAGDQVITGTSSYYGPRFDHDASGNALGLLIEESRTNYCLHSGFDTISANWTGTPTGTALNAGVSPDGTTTALSWNGGGRLLQDTFGGNGVTTNSIYIKTLSGSPSVTLVVKDNATDTVRGTTTQASTSSWARISATGTTAGATAGARLEISVSGGTALLSGAQNELSSFASSYIPTGAASVTRAPDVVAVLDPVLGLIKTQKFSVISENSLAGTDGQYNRFNFTDQDGATTTTTNGSGPDLATYNGVEAHTTIGSGSYYYPNVFRASWGGDANGISFAANGGTIGTNTGTFHTSGTVTSVWLGGYNGGVSALNGYIRNIAVYRGRLSDTVLRAKSVVGVRY